MRTDYTGDAACSAYSQGIPTGDTGGSGSHTHPDTTNNRTTGSTGSGNSFSVINPYKAAYIWTRTA